MLIWIFLIAQGVLEASLFLLGSVLQSNAIYIAVRVATIIVFSFACVRYFKKNLYQALSLVGLLIFLDQVLFKSVWLWIQFQKHPSDWAGIDRTGAIFSSAFSYVIFLPLILMLALIGVFAADYLPKRR